MVLVEDREGEERKEREHNDSKRGTCFEAKHSGFVAASKPFSSLSSLVPFLFFGSPKEREAMKTHGHAILSLSLSLYNGKAPLVHGFSLFSL